MPAISINSLIANLPPIPSRTASVGPTTPGLSPIRTVQDGVVFTRGEPWRNQAGNSTQVGYTRQDAMGGARGGTSPTTGQQESSTAPASEVGSAKGTDQGQSDAVSAQAPADSIKKPNGEPLSKAEMAVLRELRKADTAVKAHEMAHLAAAGGYAKGGASFSYQRGPDGQSYAVGGEVQVDTGKEKTPEATIQKMQIIRQAALAPADPSPQDQRVAAFATLQIAEAAKELTLTRSTNATTAAAPQGTTADAGTVQSIYQEAGQDLSQGSTPKDTAKSRKAFAAYRSSLLPPALQSDRQGGLNRIA